MRLWHYKLIPVLPKKILVSQWRELIAIIRQWEKGTLIHPLVSYVKGYDKTNFCWYTYQILNEMQKRSIKWNRYLEEEIDLFGNRKIRPNDYKEHDNEYLTICYYNLKEKYLRGIIKEEEWNKIEDLIKEERK